MSANGMRNIEAALYYASIGWPVFPCQPGLKVPATDNGFKAATTDEATIRAWWRQKSLYNIGIPAGPDTFAVIDIDTRHGGDESMAKLIERHGEPPATLQSRTGGGGRHLLYRFVEGFKNSAGKLGEGIDTRGLGGYIVVAPSMHDSGIRYAWRDWDFDSDPRALLAGLPDWLNPANVQATASATCGLPETTSADVMPEPASPAERCRAYLEKCPDAIAGQRGHDATFRAACETFRFGLSDSEAWEILQWFNQTKCQPPWSERELQHKINQGRKCVISEGSHGKWLREDAPDPSEYGAPTLAAAPSVIVNDEAPDDEPIEVPDDPGEFPMALIDDAPGMIGDLVRWITETAYRPQPVLALANSLAFFGAVIGRKVATRSDLRTNIYALGVGPSGCGKDHSRKAIKRICQSAGILDKALAGEDLASDSGLIAAIHAKPSSLLQIDEVGKFIAAANSKGAGSHQRNIPVTLTKLFSSANDVFIWKAYANRKDNPTIEIDSPNLCLYGATVPSALYEGLSETEIRDGFLGRMLVFRVPVRDDAEPRDDLDGHQDPPAGIVSTIQYWWTRTDLSMPPQGNLDTRVRPLPVEMDPEAHGMLKAFRRACDGRAKAIRRGRGEMGTDALWIRAGEHAAKVSLVAACAANVGGTPAIGAGVMDWAIRLVDHCIGDLIASCGRHVANNDHERSYRRVLAVIERAGVKGIGKSRLMQSTTQLQRRERNAILEDLIESGAVDRVEYQPKGGGRPGTRFIFKRGK